MPLDRLFTRYNRRLRVVEGKSWSLPSMWLWASLLLFWLLGWWLLFSSNVKYL